MDVSVLAGVGIGMKPVILNKIIEQNTIENFRCRRLGLVVTTSSKPVFGWFFEFLWDLFFKKVMRMT